VAGTTPRSAVAGQSDGAGRRCHCQAQQPFFVCFDAAGEPAGRSMIAAAAAVQRSARKGLPHTCRIASLASSMVFWPPI
jgi:hypothetical protein